MSLITKTTIMAGFLTVVAGFGAIAGIDALTPESAKVTAQDGPKARIQNQTPFPPQVKPSTNHQVIPAVKTMIWTPDSAVQFALGDLRTIPEHDQPYIRYISLYNVPADRREEMARIVSFAVNSLGTRRQMYIPVFVGGTENTLIRINIKDYEWNRESWENLVNKGSGPRPFPEPYFHQVVVSEDIQEKVKTKTATKQRSVERTKREYIGNDQYGKPVYQDRKYYTTEEYEETVETPYTEGSGNTKKVLAQAAWLDPIAIENLVKLTNSVGPIVRADWFITYALLPPIYYDFLRLGTDRADFQKLVFTDEKLAEKAKSQYKGVMIQSMVARNNRTLLRSPTFTNGYYWVSHDALKSVDDRKYIQNFLDEKFDATEEIGTLPNGLQAYFVTALINGKFVRQDFANPDVAIDHTAVDRVVRTGRSCIICHAEGIKPIEDEVRTLTKKLLDKEQVKLLVAKENDQYRIADLFGSNLDRQIIKDQNIYFEAVAEATGLKAPDMTKSYATFFDQYYEHLLSKEKVALEAGLPLAELDKYIRLSTDPVVLGLVKVPIRPIRRDQWEESFQRLMSVIMAAKAVPHIQPQGVLPVVPVFQRKGE